VLAVFLLIEIRHQTLRPWPASFFRSGWNIFDFLIVSYCAGAGIWPIGHSARPAHFAGAAPAHQDRHGCGALIESLMHAIPSIGWISVLAQQWCSTSYGVMGTQLYCR
jgi:hypothetical protein